MREIIAYTALCVMLILMGIGAYLSCKIDIQKGKPFLVIAVFAGAIFRFCADPRLYGVFECFN